MSDSPKILLIQLRQLGDILLTTPCVEAARIIWPKAQIDFFCHRMGRLVLKGNPHINQLIDYGDDTPALDSLKMFMDMRRTGYDLVFDFMNNPRSLVAALISGSPEKYTYSSSRSWAYKATVPRGSDDEYVVDAKLRLIAHKAAASSTPQMTLPWFATDQINWDLFQRDVLTWDEAQYRVILSPTHRREMRQWPLSRYIRLADELTRHCGACVVWAWGPGEREFVAQAQSQCRERTYLAPQTSFRQLASLIAHADYFIGNSNGPSHVAVAVRTPSFQLHGPTSLRSWCPMNRWHTGLRSEAHTMESLDFDAVLKGVLAHLMSLPRRPRAIFENWTQAVSASDRYQTSSHE